EQISIPLPTLTQCDILACLEKVFRGSIYGLQNLKILPVHYYNVGFNGLTAIAIPTKQKLIPYKSP
ncbi:MAG: hypothetical protein ACOYK8_09655, partial [Alphaproteobacteria bacterium]